jgi:hypothetical protein
MSEAAADAERLPANSEVLAGRLGLRLPESLANFLDDPPTDPALSGLLYRVVAPYTEPPSLPWAFALLQQAAQRPPLELVPVAPVDDLSLACVVCGRLGRPLPRDFGAVVRWHLEDTPSRAQRALLDIDLSSYLEAYAIEVTTREEGLRRFGERVAEYEEARGQKTPRAHEARPIRKACQNVVIGQGNWHHDGAFNGLNVTDWQTCQVPHVAAHEGNRGLLASTLAEAFRAGGTMEVRFEEHLEGRVPASLRQYGRVAGCEPGRRDAQAITPDEARELMFEVTPMNDGLREVLDGLIERGVLSPERACYLLLAGTWKPIEMEFLLRVSPRAISMLSGGADPLGRIVRQTELALGRAAVTLGMLHARLSLPLEAEDDANGHAIIVEDKRRDLVWTIDGATASVRFESAQLPPTPWGGPPSKSALVVAPRSHPGPADFELVQKLSGEIPAALVVPADAACSSEDEHAVMRCPDRGAALDRVVETRLNAARVGRA